MVVAVPAVDRPVGSLTLRIVLKINLALKFAPVFLVFFLLAWTSIDPDFGWHLQAGRYITAHGIPSHDIFTYTARNFHWIDHEWGNDVIVSILYGWGGYGLLAAVFASLWTLALIIAGAKSRILVLLLAVAALTTYTGIRPIVWTVLLLALLLKIVMSRNIRAIWLIPLIFIVWANLHAGFIAGLAVLAFFAVKKRQKILTAVLGLSVLATFINPYGPGLYVEVARTTFDGSLHFQIAEWAVFYVPIAAAAFVCLWGAGFWLLRRKKLSNWLDVGPILFAASMSATRNIPLFVVATLNDLDKFYEEIKNQLPKKPNLPTVIVKRLLALSVVGWLVYIFAITFIPWPQPYATLSSSGCRLFAS